MGLTLFNTTHSLAKYVEISTLDVIFPCYLSDQFQSLKENKIELCMFVSSEIKILLVLFITTLHIDAYFNWQMMGQVENSSPASYFMQILK